MKPPAFSYASPHTLPEALETLTRYGDDGKVLAGGQSLVPLLNMRLAQPQVLIDINRIPDLDYINYRDHNGEKGVSIGAMTRQRTMQRSTAIAADVPMLGEAIAWVGHSQIRNRGTVGGSIAHADPAAELPLVFTALDGVATVRSTRGSATISASNFFRYTFTPALEPDELLVDIWFPVKPADTGHAFLEVARRHGDFALIAVAVSLTVNDAGVCAEVRIGVGGAAATPMRAFDAEAAMRGAHPDVATFREAADRVTAEVDPPDDVHADAAYRREVAGTLTYRALLKALERIAE